MKSKVTFICPFNLNWKRGTPTRARITINKISEDFNVQILSTGDYNKNNINIKKYIPQSLPFKTFFLWVGILKELITHKKPKVIHFFTPSPVVPVLIYKLMHRDIKVVFEIHGISKFEMENKNFFKKSFYIILDKIGVKYSDEIIVMGEKVKTFLLNDYKISSKKIHPIWGPVEINKIRYIEPQKKDKFIVGYGGGSSFWQGIETIIKAADKLKKNPEIKFLFVGNISEEKYDNPGNVTFLGKVEDSEFYDCLSSCDVLISSRIGGHVTQTQNPQKLSTYLAIGRPVIGTDVSDQKLIIEKAKAGIVIPPDNVDALINGILYLYEKYNSDFQKFKKMSKTARVFAENNLTLKKLSEELKRVYGAKN